MSLKDEMVKLARTAGGSFKTRSDRESIAGRFADHLKNDLNIQIKLVDQIKIAHVEKFVEHRLNEGISKRTMQNEMASVRSVLREAGRDQILTQERLTNKSLGIDGACREGTKTALPEERYREFIRKAEERDVGVACAIGLGRELGLRAEESAQSFKSLQTWNRQLASGEKKLTVVFGTKTGRSREIFVHDSCRERVVNAIKNALAISAKNGGSLIDKPNLKTAMDKLHNEVRAVGMKGKESFHSLRYAFAQQQIKGYIEKGYSYKESLSLTSQDLGHGDGRGHYIQHVYSR